MKTPTATIMALAAIALLGTPAFANQNSPVTTVKHHLATTANAGAFTKFDTNTDGMISKEEWATSASAEQKFDAYDTNADGSVSKDEWAAHQSKPVNAKPK